MTLKLDQLQTGFFAHPDKSQTASQEVHAIKLLEPYGVEFPVCDQTIPDGHEYQWVAPSVEFTFVDCQRCRNILDLMAQAEGRGPLVMFRHPKHV